jgi:hypothetical protein
VRVERRVAGGTWVPLQTYGSTCGSADRAFVTDERGVFQRAAPAGVAPADYRVSWRHGVGNWEPSEAIHLDPALPGPPSPATG